MNKAKIKKSLKNVELFHSGEMVLKYNLETLNIKNGIDWEYMHPTNHSTYQVYLHSLPIVNDFVIVGTQTRRKNELETARNLIQEWFSNGISTEYAWHEHAVSSRLLNIIKFQEEAEDFKLGTSFFQELLIKHCLFLNDDDNYKHNNHGLMMDNALIAASFYIEDTTVKNSYINKALFRIRTSIYRDLTRQGLHVENSPEYHNLYITLLNQIFQTLKKYDIKLESNIDYLKDSAIKLRASLLKPNHEFPMIGDTGQSKYKNIIKSFDDIVDLDAGLIVLQNENKRKKILSRYFTFKCGYISKTHKHLDDLSITYYNNGHDVIIDPGKYSYNKDSYREYIVSPQAHSTVTIANGSYLLHQVGQSIRSKLGVTKYFYTDDYHLIEGINHLYEEAEIKRTCIITRADDLIIIDRVVKNNESDVLQIFNINENAEIIKKHNGFEINIENFTYTLEYIGQIENLRLDIFDGIISKEFGKKIQNKRACFTYNSSETYSVIMLKDKRSTTEIKSLDNTQLIIEMLEELISIPL